MKFNYFNADCNGDFKAKNFGGILKLDILNILKVV